MNILWIPHGTWQRRIRQRDQYFIEKLKEKHEIHILTWSEPRGPHLRYFLDPKVHIKAFQSWKKKEGRLHIHHFKRLCPSRFNLVRRINEFYFQKKIREIVNEEDIDVIICGPNQYLNGFPPFDLEVPLIFDYVDYGTKESITRTYLENSSAVLCVSNVLYEKAKKHNPNSYYYQTGLILRNLKILTQKKSD
jgi:hypothetical protein